MARARKKQANIIDESIEQVQSAYRSAEKEVKKLQKKATDSTQEFGDKVEAEARKLQKRVERSPAGKRVVSMRKDAEAERRKLQKRFERSPAGKRVESVRKDVEGFRKDVEKQVEGGVESFLSYLPVASEGDIKKLDRKLNAINRKLKSIEKAQGQQAAQ
jgi:hypothetical protein